VHAWERTREKERDRESGREKEKEKGEYLVTKKTSKRGNLEIDEGRKP
jgi:hypothetical protein